MVFYFREYAIDNIKIDEEVNVLTSKKDREKYWPINLMRVVDVEYHEARLS
jgi:hypothetical protein